MLALLVILLQQLTSNTRVIQQKNYIIVKPIKCYNKCASSVGVTMKEIRWYKYSAYIFYGEAIQLHDEVNELTNWWLKSDECCGQICHS